MYRWHILAVLVAVADASLRAPVRLNLAPDAEGGRGLALVEALSSRWGWYPVHPPTAAGLVKVVWADWRLPPPNGEPIGEPPSHFTLKPTGTLKWPSVALLV
jgi:hypothetical protein